MDKVLLDLTMDGVGHQAYIGLNPIGNGDAIIFFAESWDEDEAGDFKEPDFNWDRRVQLNLTVHQVFENAPVETVDDIAAWQLLVAGIKVITEGGVLE